MLVVVVHFLFTLPPLLVALPVLEALFYVFGDLFWLLATRVFPPAILSSMRFWLKSISLLAPGGVSLGKTYF